MIPRQDGPIPSGKTARGTQWLWALLVLLAFPHGAAASAVNLGLARWTNLSPPRISGASAVYDSLRDRIIVFGGDLGDGPGNSSWAIPLSGGPPRWEVLETYLIPPRFTWGSLAVADPARDRMVILGVHDPYFIAGAQIYELPFRDLIWRPLAIERSQSLGYSPAGSVVMDTRRERAWLYGGSYIGRTPSSSNSLKALDLTPTPRFERMYPFDPMPAGRFDHVAVYDPENDRMIVHGGVMHGTNRHPDYDRYNYSLESWELDLVTLRWKPLPSAPVQRSKQAAIYDPVGMRLIMHGGRDSLDRASGETWAMTLWRSGSAWSKLNLPSAPRFDHFAVHDSRRHRMIIGGGTHPATDGPPYAEGVFALDLIHPSAWDTLIRVDPAPGPASGSAVALDSKRGRMIHAFGRSHPSWRGRAWGRAFDDDARWTPLASENCPDLVDASAVYDPLLDRIVFYGGSTASGFSTRVWDLVLGRGPGCRDVTPTGPNPGPRSHFGAIYDPVGRRMIVCGGVQSLDSSGVWALDLAVTGHWSRLPIPDPLPRGGAGHQAFYDPVRHRMIVTGGARLGVEVWILDLASYTWTSATPGFPDRVGTDLFYDPGSDCLVSPRQDEATAILPLTPRAEWTLIPTTPAMPWESRVLVYDPSRREALVYGGRDGTETWRLSFDSTTPTLASIARTWSTPRVAGVAWRLEGVHEAGVQRSEGNGFWKPVARITPDGEGLAAFEDEDVLPGRRYGYRLHVIGDDGPAMLGEVWIEVPVEAEFSLDPPRPQPVTSDLRVSFSLPEATHAAMDLFDVSGRRVLHRDLPGLGAGRHSLNLASRGELLPGIYWLRLSAGSRRASLKVVVGE